MVIPPTTRIRALEAELAARSRHEREEVIELRLRAHKLAQHVQALTLDNEALRQTLATRGLLSELPQIRRDNPSDTTPAGAPI